MKAVEAIFNQEKALVVPFSVITNLVDLRLKLYYTTEPGGTPASCRLRPLCSSQGDTPCPPQ